MEASKKARLITTAGLTLNSGTFQGFVNAHTTENTITISGPFVYGSAGTPTGITMRLAVGQHVPIQCTSIVPQTGNIIGLLG